MSYICHGLLVDLLELGIKIFVIPLPNVRNFQEKEIVKNIFYHRHSSLSCDFVSSIFAPLNLEILFINDLSEDCWFYLHKTIKLFPTLIANWLWNISPRTPTNVKTSGQELKCIQWRYSMNFPKIKNWHFKNWKLFLTLA